MNGSVLFEGSPILSGSLNVNTGGNIEPLEVEINENGTREITPPSGVDGYAPITIDTNVPIPEPVLDTLNVTSNGTYTPPSGVDGYDEITVNVSQDADIQPLTRTITTNGTTVINASDLNVDGFDPVTITTAVDGYTIKTLANTPTPIATFSDGTANPLKSLTASIVPVQAGSGDPSPTNVRPISGWTGEVITRTGKNLTSFSLDGYWDATDGSFVSNSVWKATPKFKIEANQSYTSTGYVGTNDYPTGYALFWDANNNYLSYSPMRPTVQAPSNACYMAIYSSAASIGEGHQMTVKGTTATTYEPYAGTTTTIPFTDSQGNPVEVYGSSVDVVNGGEQPNDGKLVDFSTASIMKNNPSDNNDYLYYIRNLPVDKNKPIICSHAPFLDNPPTGNTLGIAVSGSGSIYINLTSSVMTENTVEFLRQYCINNNVQIKYVTTTPTTFYTQPTSIKSLDGENIVSASTGDVEELKYFSDH